MPISHSDRISGTIYAIAETAEHAGNLAMEYMRDKDGEPAPHDVFDHQQDAEEALNDRHRSYHGDGNRVYAISLDIRVAEEK